MSNAYAYPDDPAERQRVEAWLKQAGVSVTRPSASVIPLDHPARRKPLGLRPIIDDDERTKASREPPSDGPPMRKPADDRAAFMSDIDMIVFTTGRVIGEEVGELQREIKHRLAGLEAAQRTELADLRATVAELRGELREMKAIQEAARIASRGEQGLAGPRGIPGPPGPRGERGAPGERGTPAREVAAWEPDGSRFTITPAFTDGSRGVPANLRSLFEAYAAATEPEADDD